MSVLVSWKKRVSEIVSFKRETVIYYEDRQSIPCTQQANRSWCSILGNGTRIARLQIHNPHVNIVLNSFFSENPPWFPLPWIATWSSMIMILTWQFLCFLLALIGLHMSLPNMQINHQQLFRQDTALWVRRRTGVPEDPKVLLVLWF